MRSWYTSPFQIWGSWRFLWRFLWGFKVYWIESQVEKAEEEGGAARAGSVPSSTWRTASPRRSSPSSSISSSERWLDLGVSIFMPEMKLMYFETAEHVTPVAVVTRAENWAVRVCEIWQISFPTLPGQQSPHFLVTLAVFWLVVPVLYAESGLIE